MSSADNDQFKALIEYRRVDMTDRPVLDYAVKISEVDFSWSTAVEQVEDLDQPCLSSRYAIALRRSAFKDDLTSPAGNDPTILAGMELVKQDLHFFMLNHRTTDSSRCLPALHLAWKRPGEQAAYYRLTRQS